MTPEELKFKLDRYPVEDPKKLADDALHSLSKAWDEAERSQGWHGNLARNAIDCLEVIANKLLTMDQGSRQALELYLSLAGSGLPEFGEATQHPCVKGVMSSATFEGNVLGILRQRELKSAIAMAGTTDYLDMAHWTRRLWHSMESEGCQNLTSYDYDIDCQCVRRQNLRLLNAMQCYAHAQIRTRLLLTVATIIPYDLFDPILEFALIAESIPQDPTVLLRGKFPPDPPALEVVRTSSRKKKKKRRMRYVLRQSAFKMQYR